jgi:hypothetical protein
MPEPQQTISSHLLLLRTSLLALLLDALPWSSFTRLTLLTLVLQLILAGQKPASSEVFTTSPKPYIRKMASGASTGGYPHHSMAWSFTVACILEALTLPRMLWCL